MRNENLTPEMREAFRVIEETKENVYITGKAGTGKTTFLKYLVEHTGKRCAVVAPTGIAAVNAGGVTMHSMFCLPFHPYRPRIEGGVTRDNMDRYRLSPEKISVLWHLDLLIIDEVSMVRADTLDAVNDVLCHYRGRNKPFGGVQVVMFGDLFQLPPVTKGEDWDVLREVYDSPYFFDAKAFSLTGFHVVELDTVFRQRDPVFMGLLNRIREYQTTGEDMDSLFSLYDPDYEDPEGKAITLCTHKADAEAINANKLFELDGEGRIYRADIDGEFPLGSIPCDNRLSLKPGARVMFLVNDTMGLYCNGTLGNVLRLYPDKVVVKTDDGNEIEVIRHKWINNKYRYDRDSGMMRGEEVGGCVQLPLRLAWAITIHKSQGLTFDGAVIDAGRAFTSGQVYVALSRCRDMGGIHLLSPITRGTIMVNEVLLAFIRSYKDSMYYGKVTDARASIVIDGSFESRPKND